MTTGHEAYQLKRQQVHRQIDTLKSELVKLDLAHRADTNNWAIIGDLTKIHKNLAEALEFVTAEPTELF